jgi:hypothetical protein
MADSPKDKDLDETKRIMERLVKTPPDHKTGKGDRKPKKEKPAK